ncbi:SWF or SNF family helicase [Streptomyces sp. NPDC056628]|uniref:SWF or SNF family helicase n=1 Tax=Streptomyces sp. NPDC056628 TaxID=3345882 RepID=UPI0036C2CD8E
MTGHEDATAGHGADVERTFAAFPPARGRGFAVTWWGQAWLTALEESALDLQQLKAGRRLARAGAVGAVSVRPGRITAMVRGRDRAVHRADVLVEPLTERQWDRFLDMAVERAGHVAALLDREMPPLLVEDASVTGIDLLPGMGDLEPECACDAWDHCEHTAALCYQVARLLDEDPFVLFLMRGRGQRALLADLQARGDTASTGEVRDSSASRARPGVDAAEAYATGDILPPLPALPGLPADPGVPPSLDTETAPDADVAPEALEILAAATAVEAHRMLAQALRDTPRSPSAAPELTLAQDAVRLAAGTSDTRVTERLADGSGRGRDGLGVAVRAWRLGGEAALCVLDEKWRVEGETLARACTALETAWDEDERPPLRRDGNRWTVDGSPGQLRLGRDGRWWPYREEAGRWVPAGAPAHDPATALAAAEPDSVAHRPDGTRASEGT